MQVLALQSKKTGASMSELAKNREAVLKAVWDWKNQTPSQGDPAGALRKAALIQGLVGGLIGFGVYSYLSVKVAYVAWGLTSLIVLAGIVSPLGLYSAIKRGMEAFGGLVGKVMTWILLVPVYYLFFTPFRLLFRGGKKDSMTRWLDKSSVSYWVKREEDKKLDYERQF